MIGNDQLHVEFDKHNGFLSTYEVNGVNLMEEGSRLTPNFWRAPTDNDFGAKLQQKLHVWKDPGLSLVSFEKKGSYNTVEVKAVYEIKAVSARLFLTYLIYQDGKIRVTQKMEADQTVKIPDLFRFGMQLKMPKEADQITYYGRGPFENYVDRNTASFIGLFRQTVEEQFYPYIRPQETGTKTDVRW
jgi:beta-galactosidase